MNVIAVREAESKDVHDAARVHALSSMTAYVGLLPPSEMESLTRRESSWQAALAQPDVSPFVAECDGEIVGVMMIGPAREEAGAGEIYVMYVHPDWWGSGAGQVLMDRAHQQLRQDYGDAVLSTLGANGRARRFYERNGWVLDSGQVEPHLGAQATKIVRYRKQP